MTSTSVQTDDSHVDTGIDRPGWLEYEEFPFENRAVEVDGNRIHYIDEGTGPTLLFVHAGPAWSFVFRDVIRELRHDFRCVALDFPGTGLSTASPKYEPSIEHATDVLEGFLDAVSLESATAVVHDIGGPVTLGVAARQPEGFSGFVIMGSFGWPLTGDFASIARVIGIVDGTLFGLVNTHLNLLIRLTATRFGAGRRLSKPGKRVFRGPFAARQRRRNSLAMLGSALDSEDRLETVEQSLRSDLANHPVLLLFGEHDEGRQAGFQDKWERTYPGARSAVVPGANHFPMADAPHFVSDEIEDWHRTVFRA